MCINIEVVLKKIMSEKKQLGFKIKRENRSFGIMWMEQNMKQSKSSLGPKKIDKGPNLAHGPDVGTPVFRQYKPCCFISLSHLTFLVYACAFLLCVLLLFLLWSLHFNKLPKEMNPKLNPTKNSRSEQYCPVQPWRHCRAPSWSQA